MYSYVICIYVLKFVYAVCIQVKGGFMHFVTKCKCCTVTLQHVHKEDFVYCIHKEYCNKEEICNLFPWILERGNIRVLRTFVYLLR